jgi:translation initiation factor IF-3
VRVIDEEGNQVGIIPTRDALEMARQRGLDLVEVAPNAVPPVCRLMDYGKFRYEQSRRERESRKHQHVVELKEIRLQPKIDDHDVETKRRQAMKFLEGGDKVKFTVRFRGREMAHPEIGRQILEGLAEGLRPFATIEQTPRMEGRTMTLHLAPLKQKQSQADRERERERARSRDGDSQNQHEGTPAHAEDEDAQGREEALQDHGDGQDSPREGHEEPLSPEEGAAHQADVRPDDGREPGR